VQDGSRGLVEDISAERTAEIGKAIFPEERDTLLALAPIRYQPIELFERDPH
jgi:hypothetical protein